METLKLILEELKITNESLKILISAKERNGTAHNALKEKTKIEIENFLSKTKKFIGKPGMNINALASIAGVKPHTVYDWLSKGYLSYEQVGKQPSSLKTESNDVG